MLYKLWQFIQLFLPFGLIIRMYKGNKALPANIRTRRGTNLKAIMITTDYGILVTESKYFQNRAKMLKQKKKLIEDLNQSLINELNELNLQEKEQIVEYMKEEGNGNI